MLLRIAMKRLIGFSVLLTICLLSHEYSYGQTGGGTGTGGGAGLGNFQGADGTFGADRVTRREDIQDNRAATNTGENNFTLGGGQAAQNNMSFLNALFGGGANNQANNQNTPLRGRGVRAPYRIGFKFAGASEVTGLNKLNARIVKIPKFKNSKIRGVIQDRTLLLVGEVASPEEVSLAVRIARFEPGVDQVKSLLTIAKKPN